jgi:membrane protein
MGIIERGKAIWARLSRTQLLRAWNRYGDRRGNRLAGATSFFGFLSMFPLIVLAAAVVGGLLPASAIERLKDTLHTYLPGISDKIDVDALVANAGTIGLVSAVALLFTGLGWIDCLRASIRSMHELDDQPGSLVKLKVIDLVALVGLGLIGLLATAASSVLSGLSQRIVGWTGIEGTWMADWGIAATSVVVGILTGSVLFLYLQTVLPRIVLPRKVALIAAVAGGVIFYAAQKLGNLYVSHVIQNNAAYGALALPLALLVWIYLLTRVIMLIAAWTKEATLDHRWHTGEAEEAARAAMPFETNSYAVGSPRRRGVPAGAVGTTATPVNHGPDDEGLLPGPPGKRYKVIPIPERKADTVAVAAGAILGATATALTLQLTRAARLLRR